MAYATQHWLVTLITDLKSAKAIIKLIKKEKPTLSYVAVPRKVRDKILDELETEMGAEPYGFRDTTISGVWVRGE